MAYGFNLGQIEGLDSSVKTVTLTIADQSTANTYNLAYNDTKAGWETDGAKLYDLGSSQGYALEITALTSEDVGDSYNVSISADEVTETFKAAVELVLPSSTFDVTQTLDFSNLETTATVAGNSFTKTSNVALTAEQLNGATFKAGDSEMPINSDMLSDMTALGVTGTLITLPSPYGPAAFSCTEAGSVVSEPGCYLATQMLSYVDYVTLSYTETCEATVKAVATGTAELTDNASSLPDGVIYLQIEG